MSSDFMEDFRYLIAAFEEGYIFREQKEALLGQPLATVVERFKDRAVQADSPREFWLVLREMLDHIGDGHCGIQLPMEEWAAQAGRQAPSRPRRPTLSAQWVPQLAGAVQLTVGDLYFPDDHESERVAEELDDIFDHIAEATAIILDCRFCAGGTPKPYFDLISRLIDRPVPNFQRRWYISDIFLMYHDYADRFRSTRGLTEWESDGGLGKDYIHPSTRPSAPSGSKLLILVGASTVSRGEQLALVLAEAGLGTIVGWPTAGSDAFPLTFPLPRTKWNVSMSVGEARSAQGYTIEGNGLPLATELRHGDHAPVRESLPEAAVRVLAEMMAV